MKYLLFVFLICAVFYSCLLPRYAKPFTYDPTKAGADIVERIDGSKMKPVFFMNTDFLYSFDPISEKVYCAYGTNLFDEKLYVNEYNIKTSEINNTYIIDEPMLNDVDDIISNARDIYAFGSIIYFVFRNNIYSNKNHSFLRYDLEGTNNSYCNIIYDSYFIVPVCFKINEKVTELMYANYQYFGEVDYDASGDVILKDFIFDGYNVSQVFSDKLLKINRGGYFVYFDPIGLRIFVNDSYYYEPESRYYHTMYIYHLSTGELKTVTLSYLLLTDYLRTRDVSGDEIWLNTPDSGDAVKIRLLN